MSLKLSSDVAAAVSMSSGHHGVDPCLLAALIIKESSGNPAAIRYEPQYRYVWDVLKNRPYSQTAPSPLQAPPDFKGLGGVHPQLEWTLQKCSIGACQVMGAVARELGFPGQFLTELIAPEIGIEYGAKKLGMLLKKFDVEDALSAYNAGTPTEVNYKTYVVPILMCRNQFQAEGF